MRGSPQPSPKKNVKFTDHCTNVSPHNHGHNVEMNHNVVPQTVSYDQRENDKVYATRSGRLVKKPDKLDL